MGHRAAVTRSGACCRTLSIPVNNPGLHWDEERPGCFKENWCYPAWYPVSGQTRINYKDQQNKPHPLSIYLTELKIAIKSLIHFSLRQQHNSREGHTTKDVNRCKDGYHMKKCARETFGCTAIFAQGWQCCWLVLKHAVTLAKVSFEQLFKSSIKCNVKNQSVIFHTRMVAPLALRA